MAHGYADIAMRRYRAGPLNILIFKKLEGLSWVGEVVNHIWIYGSKVAEGSSAFQRRSCDYVPIIVSSWNFQELLPMTDVKSMQKVKVKGQGHRGHNPT